MTRPERLLALVSVVLTLLGVEAAARVWVALRWPPGQAYQLTHATSVRGSYASDRVLMYTLAPSYSFGDHSHNSLGFRGAEFRRERTPGIARIVLMGASTVYSPGVKDDETSSVRLQEALAARGVRAEVINAGVPGWTSRETRLSLEPRILPLAPDVIVIVDGRNDSYPQLFRNYRDDYSHYRNLDYDMQNSNRAWKRVFRVSYLLMGLLHRSESFGFVPSAEHPHYGSIRFENQPTVAEAESSVGAPERTRQFVENVRGTLEAARAAGITPVLATIPYRGGDDYVSGNLKRVDGFEPVVSRAVAINQDLTRRLAAETGSPLLDTPELWAKRFMHDDCHLNAAGGVAFAARLVEVVAPLLAQRAAAGASPPAP